MIDGGGADGVGAEGAGWRRCSVRRRQLCLPREAWLAAAGRLPSGAHARARRDRATPPCAAGRRPSPSSPTPVVQVTGANSGIGKETARQLVGLDATVILACRSQSKAAATCFELRESHIVNGRPGLGVAEQLMGGKGVEPMVVDLADNDSIQRFVAEFKRNHDRLDALVNNAATIAGSLQHNQDGVELTFATNHAGPVLLTSALLPLLQRSGTKERPSRIVNVASRLERQGKCDPDFLAGQRQTRPLDPKRGYEPLGHYCDSKLCNMLYTRSLSSFLDERVTVAAGTIFIPFNLI